LTGFPAVTRSPSSNIHGKIDTFAGRGDHQRREETAPRFFRRHNLQDPVVD
jgi:hypothetical protein